MSHPSLLRFKLATEALEFLKRMVRIPSVNPPGNELAAAILLKELLDAHGVKNKLIKLNENRASLVAYFSTIIDQSQKIDLDKGPNMLAFSGHLDVVPPGRQAWKHDPFSADEEEGRIFGRGTSDMKGGLVAMVFALLDLKKTLGELPGDVKLFASAGEEVHALGAKQLTSLGYTNDISALVIGEPTRDEVVVAHKGAFWVELTSKGRTAHGAMPSLGINAIINMHHVIQTFLEEFQFEICEHPILNEPTYNFSMIEGGVSTNVVPDKCSVQIDFRTVDPHTHATILEKIYEIIEITRTKHADIDVDITVLNDLRPVNTSEHEFLVKIAREAIHEVCQSDSNIKGVNYYTDAAAFVQEKHSFPVIILGPGDERLAHQPDEYIEVENFLRAIQYYKVLVMKYFNVV